jgi:hypothetical protein
MNVCHDENAVLTPDGCVQIEDLTGTEIILDAWDCAADGNMVCGSPLSVENVNPAKLCHEPGSKAPSRPSQSCSSCSGCTWWSSPGSAPT